MVMLKGIFGGYVGGILCGYVEGILCGYVRGMCGDYLDAAVIMKLSWINYPTFSFRSYIINIIIKMIMTAIEVIHHHMIHCGSNAQKRFRILNSKPHRTQHKHPSDYNIFIPKPPNMFPV